MRQDPAHAALRAGTSAVQREIDRVQEQGPGGDEQIHALWERKRDLLMRIEALND